MPLLGIAVHCYGIAMVLLYDFCGIPRELLGDSYGIAGGLQWQCYGGNAFL